MEQEPVEAIQILMRQATATYKDQTFRTKEPNRLLFSKILGSMTAIFVILYILSEIFEQKVYGEYNRQFIIIMLANSVIFTFCITSQNNFGYIESNNIGLRYLI
jgi:hypothetical protein